MKNIMFAFAIMVSFFLTVHIVMAIDSRSIRQNEAQTSLSSTIAGVMDDLCLDRHYTIEKKNLFITDFLQAMTARVTSDSTITVKVLSADMEKGLLTFEVMETFRYPNGKEGNVTAVKTILLEHTEESGEPGEYVLRYQMEKDGNMVDYKVYRVPSGGTVTAPKDPVPENKTFDHWADENGIPVSFMESDGTSITINTLAGEREELILKAVYH